MATLLKYKKGLKRPTLAWNEFAIRYNYIYSVSFFFFFFFCSSCGLIVTSYCFTSFFFLLLPHSNTNTNTRAHGRTHACARTHRHTHTLKQHKTSSVAQPTPMACFTPPHLQKQVPKLRNRNQSPSSFCVASFT